MSHVRRVISACMFAAAVFMASSNVEATAIEFNAYADDFGILFIDGLFAGSYDNAAAAGNIVVSLDLDPGWHDIAFTYRNRAGTNRLGFSWILPGGVDYVLIPTANLRSQDAGGSTVAGLRGDYFDLAGVFQFSKFGEGPILHGANSFVEEIYEGNIGLWADVYGPFAQFEERLSGQFLVPESVAVPEPSMLALTFTSLLGVAARRRTRRRRDH